MQGDIKELLTPRDEDPMVVRFQEVMNEHLRNHLEKLEKELQEKRKNKKEQKPFQDLENDIANVKIAISKKKGQLDECIVVADRSRGRCVKAQDEEKKLKNELETIRNEKIKLENEVNQKQAELDDLHLKLLYTQKYNEALHGDLKAKKNLNQETATQKKKAEEQKLQQDLCVDRLTRELQRVTEQIKMHDAQITAQTEKKERAKNTSSEAEMLLEDMILNHKLVEQKWKSRLRMMEKSIQTKNAIHEELCAAMQEVSLLDREIQMHRKSNNEKQETNEKLTVELQMAQNEYENLEKKINRKKDEEEALLAQYSSYKSSLKEAENTLLSLKKEAGAAQSALNTQRKQLEKESVLRLDLEGKIRTQMQQMIVHNRTAKNYQQLFSKLTHTKNEKMCQLLQLENELAAVENRRNTTTHNVDALNISLEYQEKEIAEKTEHIKSCEAKLYSLNKEIEQNYRTIEHIKNKMAEITARTGDEDYSPYEAKIQELKEERRNLEETVKSHTQLWLTKQETRVRLTLEYEATNKVIQKLQMDYTTLQKKKTCQDGLMEIENRELMQLENKANMLKVSLNKINIQINENGKQRMLLEEKKTMMEIDFLGRLKEAEQAAAEIHMKYERIEEEKENIYNCLMASEKQIMVWEKKIQLKKEARSEFEKQNEEVEKLKMEVQNKELQLSRKVKQGEKLLKECEATAVQCCNIFDRVMVLRHTSDKVKHYRKCQMERSLEARKRNLRKVKKQLRDLDEELEKLMQNKTIILEHIEKKTEAVTERHLKNEALSSEITKLQDDKQRSLFLTVALQNWAKRLKMLRDGSSKAPSNTEAVAAAFNKEAEKLHCLYEKVQHVCQECPENQEELRRLRIALEAQIMFLKI